MGEQREGNFAAELRVLERDPSGSMDHLYPGWAPSQAEIRRRKETSGAVSEPVERNGDLASDELNESLRALAELVSDPDSGLSREESLKNFIATIINGDGSPADPEVHEPGGARGEAKQYGHAAPAPTGRKGLAEREDKKDDDEDDEDEDDKEERKHEREEAAKRAATYLSLFRKTDARLSAMEERWDRLEALLRNRLGPATPSAGRSVEASNRTAPAAESAPAAGDGVYVRGQAAEAGDAADKFGREAVKVLDNARGNRALFGKLQREAADALTVLQAGGRPLLNQPQLQEVASRLGLPYGSGSSAFGRSE